LRADVDWKDLQDPLSKQLYAKKDGILYQVYRCEADEMWSFVGDKANKQCLPAGQAGIWLVMNTANRQILAFHVGGQGGTFV
jgi:insertion element IS1 protein InsB